MRWDDDMTLEATGNPDGWKGWELGLEEQQLSRLVPMERFSSELEASQQIRVMGFEDFELFLSMILAGHEHRG